MQRFLWVVSALFIVIASGGVAHADSDGYYCSATNLLAYEISFSDKEPGHWLHVVQYGSNGSGFETANVELPAFQVHGMRCSSTQVEILGWKNLFLYDVGDGKQPKLEVDRTLSKPGARPEGFKDESGNLGAWFRDPKTGYGFGQVRLKSTDTNHKYVLDISLQSHPKKACTYVVQSRLLKLNSNGGVSADLIIVKTERAGECG